MSKLTICLVLATALACDHNPSIAAASCQPAVSLSPSSGTISVGDSIVVVMSVEAGCSAPLVRNETPVLIRVDPISVGTFSVIGLAQGVGHVHLAAASDTLVTRDLVVSVVRAGASIAPIR